MGGVGGGGGRGESRGCCLGVGGRRGMTQQLLTP